MSKAVIVLGNARSGTSMTAGLLSILGVNMHESKNPAKVPTQNPKGSFENPNFAHLTAKMHKEYAEGTSMRVLKKEYERRFKELISIHTRPLWGFKSAVTHHFLGIILPLLKNPHLVIVVRSLLHNAESWIVHMREVYGRNVTMEAALSNMYKSQAALMSNSLAAPCPKIYTSYEGIKADPWEEAVQLAEFIGVDPTPKKEQIMDFVMPDYSTLNSS